MDTLPPTLWDCKHTPFGMFLSGVLVFKLARQTFYQTSHPQRPLFLFLFFVFVLLLGFKKKKEVSKS